MTKKLIEVSETSAINIEAIKMENGTKHLSIRKMYKTKKDPDWKPAAQGMTLQWDISEKFLKKALKLVRDPETKFKKIASKSKGKKDE